MLSGGQRQRIAIARAFARDSSSSTGAGSSSAAATRSLSRWGLFARIEQLQRADDLGASESARTVR
jgi:ABC-type multidrug transport system fused ATPase/permease subunit